MTDKTKLANILSNCMGCSKIQETSGHRHMINPASRLIKEQLITELASFEDTASPEDRDMYFGMAAMCSGCDATNPQMVIVYNRIMTYERIMTNSD
jgi:hypothetical protein